MKLTKANAEKLFLTRARLWANIYWSITDASKGSQTVILKPVDEADKAMERFDKRFQHRLSGEAVCQS